MEDQTLIDLYWSRDEAAIAQTAAKYGRLCSYIAGNILKSPEDCEECVNDSYLAVWNAIPTQRPERFSVFLSRITRNLALKRWEYLSAGKRNACAVLSLEELGESVSGRESVENALEARRIEAPSALSSGNCRRKSGWSSCGGTGTSTPSRPSAGTQGPARAG